MANLGYIDFEFLPANLHNTPDQIVPAVIERIERLGADYRRVFVAYADCGTGGGLDRALDRLGVERLPGAHCYEFFAGSDTFAPMAARELGTFYLTDFLTRHFVPLVWEGLGLDRHPQLRDPYFANYTRVVYLSQSPTESLLAAARDAADRLGLDFEHCPTGLEPFSDQIRRQIGPSIE